MLSDLFTVEMADGKVFTFKDPFEVDLIDLFLVRS